MAMDPTILDAGNTRIAGGFRKAFLLMNAVAGPLLDEIAVALATAVVRELKEHAKITITLDIPNGTATAVIE